MKASTSAYSSKKITKIVVNASAANSGSPKVSCTVGGEDFGTKQSLTTSNAPYSFTGSASGDIVVSITKTKSTKALYLKSVEVTYSEEGKTTTSVSFPQSAYTFDLGSGLHDFTNAAVLSPAEAGTVVYTVDKDWVEIDNGYVVVQTDEVGTATVTATFAGNDNYTESSASYTISVVKPLEDGVFDFTGSLTYGSGLTETGSDYYKTPIVFTAGNVTITTKTTSGNGFRWWTNTTDKTNELRFYTGTTFTVSVPDGYVITSIDFTGEKFTTDCGTYTSTSASGKWTGNSQSVTFKPSDSGNYVRGIKVTYVKTETLTTAASGYATYAADYATNYSEAGLTAYTVKVNGEKVVATEYTGVVPAGEAVLVKGEANKEYTLAPATEDAGEFVTELKASDGNVTSDGKTYFAFSSKGGTKGFKVVGNGIAIPAKKGYLVVADAAAGANFLSFDDETTGINAVEAAAAADGKAYNMAGQRVSKAYKGIVIVGGKKYLNK